MILTILIPTITGREAQFEELTAHLYNQITTGVDIKYYRDNKELSIGMKRQVLLNNCEAEYFVMIDDDDTTSETFIEDILQALETKPDCVTYQEQINLIGGTQTANHSNKYEVWGNNHDGYSYTRTPFYKDVIRTNIAKQIGFKDVRYGEDHDFATRLKASGLIKTEVHIDKPMYIYNAPKGLSAREHKLRYGIK